ncbi:MAG: glucose-1-phosphate cytidylyltransferase [Egibacteraceae bacterium]
MKVVLFCGGLGTRLRDYSESVPKPMATIGHRPILWHVMKYYAHFGHTDFILCLGYKSEVIKEYFLDYREWLSNDFVLSGGGQQVHLLNRDIDDWRITFVDTGVNTSIGQRLKAVERHLEGEEVFMANYSDGLTDLPLPDYLAAFLAQDRIAGFLAVRSTQSFHVASIDEAGLVTSIDPLSDSGIWINGGFFVFRREIFAYLRDGEDLVFEPFQRLIASRQLWAHRYHGFWTAMDTFKDKRALDDLYEHGAAPWELWKQPAGTPVPPVSALRP